MRSAGAACREEKPTLRLKRTALKLSFLEALSHTGPRSRSRLLVWLMARAGGACQLLTMSMLPRLPKSAAEYRSDAERCRRLAKGVGEGDAAMMLSLARGNDCRAAQVEAIDDRTFRQPPM